MKVNGGRGTEDSPQKKKKKVKENGKRAKGEPRQRSYTLTEGNEVTVWCIAGEANLTLTKTFT